MIISQDQQPIETGLGARSEPDEILSGIDLNGKNVLVTGGYSGIGLETTRALAKAGAHVHVPARRPETAQAALDGILDGFLFDALVDFRWPSRVQNLLKSQNKMFPRDIFLLSQVLNRFWFEIKA